MKGATGIAEEDRRILYRLFLEFARLDLGAGLTLLCIDPFDPMILNEFLHAVLLP